MATHSNHRKVRYAIQSKVKVLEGASNNSSSSCVVIIPDVGLVSEHGVGSVGHNLHPAVGELHAVLACSQEGQYS